MCATRSSNVEPFIWLYQNEDSTWIQFTDIENEIIEQSYSNNQTKVELDHFFVDLDKLIVIEKNLNKVVKPIKREMVSRSEMNVRPQRFYVQPKLVQSFNHTDSNDRRFISQWKKQNRRLPIDQQLEKAAEGIFIESKKLDQQIEGEWISKEIRLLKGKSSEEIDKQIIVLYTRESFLYRLINSTLRDNDQTKLETLGPFCQLLFHCDCSTHLRQYGYSDQLYRGAQLDQQTIEEYQQSIGLTKTWDAFSSTSKKKENALCFGNVLFIINLAKSAKYRFSGMDISSLSIYPEEAEVLIRAARNFIVDQVEKDPKTNKYFIYLSMC